MGGPVASVPVLLGPTATGKTAVAVEVARRLGGEIVSADSRAFFEGLDVVTAKASESERGGIPHHLIDCVPIDGAYDAMSFRRDVERLVPEILDRGRLPLLVGGGTLYLGAILRGIFEGPSKDEEFRRSLADRPTETLHDRLRTADPNAAEGIHRNDRLRIVRALEVYASTGRPISELKSEAVPLPYDFIVFGLRRASDDHRRAIEARVRSMVDAGLVDEVERLVERGLTAEAQAYRTIGIPEVVGHLEGRTTEEEMEQEIVRRTWSLARRQLAWFRKDRDVIWLDVTGRTTDDLAASIVGRLRERLR